MVVLLPSRGKDISAPLARIAAEDRLGDVHLALKDTENDLWWFTCDVKSWDMQTKAIPIVYCQKTSLLFNRNIASSCQLKSQKQLKRLIVEALMSQMEPKQPIYFLDPLKLPVAKYRTVLDCGIPILKTSWLFLSDLLTNDLYSLG